MILGSFFFHIKNLRIHRLAAAYEFCGSRFMANEYELRAVGPSLYLQER